MFVDDSPVNVAAAEAEGLLALRFRDAGQLRADLADLGLLPAAPAARTAPTAPDICGP